MTREERINENNSMLSSPNRVKTGTFDLQPSPLSKSNLSIMYIPSGQVIEIERADVPELIRSLRTAYNIP